MGAMHVTGDTFETEVLQSEKPVIVDFWATWCGPCQMMGPIMDEIADERTDIKVCKVDVDENPEIARKYRVLSIPMLFVFKNGEIANRIVGALSKEDVLQMVEDAR